MKKSSPPVSVATPEATSDEDEAARIEKLIDLNYTPRTELGRLALAARREYFESGGRPLSLEEISREVAELRGGTHLLDDQ